MHGQRHHWALVIFACRESLPTLRQTLNAAAISAKGCTRIHVLVNGNTRLAQALAEDLSEQNASVRAVSDGPGVRVWSIPFGDKANAWNAYVHHIWNGEELSFFIDGYVRLNFDAVDLLGNAMAANDRALGGSGVPTMGESSTMLRINLIVNTGFHGNFCCIKGGPIRQMREAGIRLPVGLYRTDSLMGALLCYAFHPADHVWEDHRIHVHPKASWQIDTAKWWQPKDALGYFKRRGRQLRGDLEKAAIADHLSHRRLSAAAFPSTAKQLVMDWIERAPADFQRMAQSTARVRQAVAAIHKMDPVPEGALNAELVWTHDASSAH
jgi:hypothetical protein